MQTRGTLRREVPREDVRVPVGISYGMTTGKNMDVGICSLKGVSMASTSR